MIARLVFCGLISTFSLEAHCQTATEKTAAPASTVSLKKDIKNENNRDLKEVLNQFLAISKIYRRSGEEKKVRDLLEKIAERQGLAHSVDGAGNLIVSIPGTGKFATQTHSIGLQGHMDMVQDVQGLKAGEKSSTYFEKPLDLVVENGVIESNGHLTSIGADDGAGVAIMTRYMRHPELEHPPLKLFFTTEEETGMSGALKLDLPNDLRAFINLDDEKFGEVATGCLGFHMVKDDYQVAASPISGSDFQAIHVSLSGLLGGHSGDDIYRGRGNASKITAEILKRTLEASPRALAIKSVAGETSPTVFNKIPKSAEITLAIPTADVTSVTAAINSYQQELFNHRKDQAEKFTIAVTTPSDAKITEGVPLASISKLINTLTDLKNGVITQNPDFTYGMDLSSNFSFFGIEKNEKDAGYRIRVGLMPRSFSDPVRNDFVASVKTQLQNVDLKGDLQVEHEAPAWTPDPQSKLLATLKTRFQKDFPNDKFEPISVAGGLETAYFSSKAPNLPMISIGPTIENEHSFNETLDIQSVAKMMTLLDDLVVDIGNNSEIMQ